MLLSLLNASLSVSLEREGGDLSACGGLLLDIALCMQAYRVPYAYMPAFSLVLVQVLCMPAYSMPAETF